VPGKQQEIAVRETHAVADAREHVCRLAGREHERAAALSFGEAVDVDVLLGASEVCDLEAGQRHRARAVVGHAKPLAASVAAAGVDLADVKTHLKLLSR